MKAGDQGTGETRGSRYRVVPRTLVFITGENPQTRVQEILLIKGSPTKRLWANLYNGLGGHVEADEDLLAAARREVKEETGLAVKDLVLRGVINIRTDTGEPAARPGVMVFVFHGASNLRDVKITGEGTPEWLPVADLDQYPLVDDLYHVIPRTLANGALFFGHYTPDPDGTMRYSFV